MGSSTNTEPNTYYNPKSPSRLAIQNQNVKESRNTSNNIRSSTSLSQRSRSSMRSIATHFSQQQQQQQRSRDTIQETSYFFKNNTHTSSTRNNNNRRHKILRNKATCRSFTTKKMQSTTSPNNRG